MIETAEANATHQQDTTLAPPKPRLLDQMREVIRVKHYWKDPKRAMTYYNPTAADIARRITHGQGQAK